MNKIASRIAVIILSGFVLSACTQSTPTASSLPQPSVPTLVAQTLMALTATPPVPATLTPPAASPTPRTAAPSATAQPTPTAQPAAPTAAAQPTSPPAATPQPMSTQAAAPPACIDKAAFYGDVTIPDDTLLDMNTEFVKTWRVRNEGTCTWDGYTLVFAGGSPLNGPQSNPMPKTAPGAIIEVSVKLRTPNQGGTYNSDWEFQTPAGKRFGVNANGIDKIWTKIKVNWGAGNVPTASAPAASTGSATASCAVERNAGYEAQILASINNARAAKSLPALKLQSQLSAAAFAHSSDMACKNFVDHTGSDGFLWYQRIKTAGYAYSYASENIYSGDPAFGGDANGAFTWWMNSQVHRDNILSTKISEIGIAYAYYSKAQFKGYYTLVFARP